MSDELKPIAWRLRWTYPSTGQSTSWFTTTDSEVARQKEADGLEVEALCPLSLLEELKAENERLRAAVQFTLSDASRMLSKSDVEGICSCSEICFQHTDRVRCGPCAVKVSAAKSIKVDDTYSHLPEVAKLRRELKAVNKRLAEAVKILDRFARLSVNYANNSPSDAVYANGCVYVSDIRAVRDFVEKVEK